MARPVRGDATGAALGAAIGAGVAGPFGAALGGLFGASLGGAKYSLDAAIQKLLAEHDLELRAFRWVTKRRLEVAYARSGGPLHVADLSAPTAVVNPEDIADAIYDALEQKLEAEFS